MPVKTPRKKRRNASQAQKAYFALLSTADRVRAFMADTIERHGITRQQYNVLRILRGAQPEGLPTLTIADRMIEQAPGMTRMIDRLEAKRLVERERRAQDRRCVHCRITAKGLKLLLRLDQPVEEANKAAFAALNVQELAQLVNLLHRARVRQGKNIKT
jgi:MarR family transcriptional regulator, organic hydroperoxide resistance regulator